jgi:hypothetical protein
MFGASSRPEPPAPIAQVPHSWLARITQLAGAGSVGELWKAAVGLLAQIVPHHAARVWFDCFDLGISDKAALIFEFPPHECSEDESVGRFECLFTAQFVREHVGRKYFRTADIGCRRESFQSESRDRFTGSNRDAFVFNLAFWRSGKLSSAIRLYRTEKQGEVTSDEICQVELVYPLLEAAILRLQEQEQMRVTRVMLENFVLRFAVGLIVLNWDLEAVFVNDEGHRLAFYWINGRVRRPALDPLTHFRIPAELREFSFNRLKVVQLAEVDGTYVSSGYDTVSSKPSVRMLSYSHLAVLQAGLGS